MQHLYSLRPVRALTAASEENPLPAPSTAKTRRFISNNIGHAIRRTAGGTLSAPLAQKLQKLIAMEKNILRSMENVSKERSDNARQLSVWGDEQEDDVSDVSEKLSVLLYEVGDLEDQYVDRYDQYRKALKEIRNIEKLFRVVQRPSHLSSDSATEKQKLEEQIGKLQAHEAPPAQELEDARNELVRVEVESIVAEVQLKTITREKVKSDFNYPFDVMREFGEKMAIIAGYGKHLLELIEDTAAVPGEGDKTYSSYDASEAIVKECDRSLTIWVGSNAAVSTRLSTRVQLMLRDKETAGDGGTVVGTLRPANARRWSSDSETGGSSPVTKRTDATMPEAKLYYAEQ